MNKQNIPNKTALSCLFLAVMFVILTVNQKPASGTSAATYSVDLYKEYGPEPDPRWQHDLPGATSSVYGFMSELDANQESSYSNNQVIRSNIRDRYGTGFDRYDLVYWHAHSHTLPYNAHSSGDPDWWYDPDDLYNWGKSINPYIPSQASVYNPTWFTYPCNNNQGPGYTYADSPYGKTVGMPTYNGYYGRYCGESILTLCDLNRLESGGGDGHGLGYYNNEWMVMDSCDAVRVADLDGESSLNDGVVAWDQTFDGLHGVYGHYVSIYLDGDKAKDFGYYLVNDDLTIWEAYKKASLNSRYIRNRRVSVITAENQPRYWWCFNGNCFWLYPNYSEMSISDHWWGHGDVADDIERLDIDYFYTTWYDPD